ncbi:MAG TPA: hypothetical protein VFD64_20795 [Gemmatimonadaceae bacterium]|nr:hypothetical protein [Gemmatimonadaceae bacterium]
MRRILLGLIVAVTAACQPPTSTARQFAARIEASPLVGQLGDTVTFVVNVTANNVSAVVINYGDSNSDQYSTGGGPFARVTFKHAYLTTGNYLARATVSDAVIGNREVSQLIVVNPRSDSTSLRQ